MTIESPQSPPHKYLGAVAITVVVSVIALHDQITSNAVDKWVLVVLTIMFLGWLGENVIALLQNIFGRGQ